jgi:hypothetical protein
MNPRRLAAVLLSFVGPGLAAGAAERPVARPDPLSPAWASFERAFRAGIDREGIVGGCVALVSSGRVQASACHGLRDREKGIPADLGYVFLGRILEQLSGEDYEVYVDKNLLRPLAMHESYFDRAPYHLQARRSHSYEAQDGALREAPFDFDTGVTVSNGGLMAPLTDMAKYIAFLIGEPARPEHEGVLRRSTLSEMWQPQLEIRGEDPGQQALGLGFFLERREGRTLVGHSGGQAGFISHFYVDPVAGAGYVVAFNTDVRTAGRQRTRELDAELRDRLLREVWPALPAPAPR